MPAASNGMVSNLSRRSRKCRHILRNSLQLYDQAYCTTGHNLDAAIGPALWGADREELREVRTMAAAIRKNFSSRCRSNLVTRVEAISIDLRKRVQNHLRMAVFDCNLIRLICRTGPFGLIDLTWVNDELSGLKDLERVLREGHPLKSDQAAFLAAFTGLLIVISKNLSLIG